MSNGEVEAKADEIKILPKRRLQDLYRVGVAHSIRGPVQNEDDVIEMIDIPVWISKISQLEERECGNKASRARGALQAIARQPLDHSDWDEYKFRISDYDMDGRDTQILFLISTELDEFKLSAREKLASADEWAKDDYLISLEQAWEASLREAFIQDATDPEAKRVFDALKKFMEEIEKESEAEKINLIESYYDDTDEEVLHKTLKKLVEIESNISFVNEFRNWQVYYSVRDIDDHSERYFESREDLDTIDDIILNDLKDAFLMLSVDSIEGKD